MWDWNDIKKKLFQTKDTHFKIPVMNLEFLADRNLTVGNMEKPPCQAQPAHLVGSPGTCQLTALKPRNKTCQEQEFKSCCGSMAYQEQGFFRTTDSWFPQELHRKLVRGVTENGWADRQSFTRHMENKSCKLRAWWTFTGWTWWYAVRYSYARSPTGSMAFALKILLYSLPVSLCGGKCSSRSILSEQGATARF